MTNATVILRRVALLLVVVALAATSSAQDLSGTWLRATGRVRLLEVETKPDNFPADLSGKPTRRAFTTRFWIRFDAQTAGGYLASVYDDTPEGLVRTTTGNVVEFSESVVDRIDLVVPVTDALGNGDDAFYVTATASGRLVVKTNAEGDVTSGRFSSASAAGDVRRYDGATSTSAALSHALDLRVKASVVDTDDVPPIVTALLPELFTDRASYFAANAATKASADYTDNLQPGATFTSGSVTFVAADPSTLFFATWSADFPDDNDVELALNDSENLDVRVDTEVSSIGVDFDDASGGASPSTFTISAFRGAIQVASFDVSLPDPSVDFLGVSSPLPFDRLVIREATSANENEFFGSVFTSFETADG